MKVIFLDIDGVLNSQRSFAALQHREKRFKTSSKDNTLQYFYKITMMTLDKVAVGLINRVVSETDAKIVLSSTHRKHFNNPATGEYCMADIQIYLKALGIKGEVIGCTPITNKGFRGEEIKMWLGEHPEVTKYAIIDDDSDMLEEQHDFFVHTDGADGISFADYRMLVKILEKKSD